MKGAEKACWDLASTGIRYILLRKYKESSHVANPDHPGDLNLMSKLVDSDPRLDEQEK
jgi:hypothetical protein